MRKLSDKIRREKSKHTFYFQYIFSENRAVYEIMWNNIVQPDRQARDDHTKILTKYAICVRSN